MIINEGAQNLALMSGMDTLINTKGVWEVTINDTIVSNGDFTLAELINKEYQQTGLYADTTWAEGLIALRATSNQGTKLVIKYLGEDELPESLTNSTYNFYSTTDKTLTYGLGGCYYSTIWTYPQRLALSKFDDGGIERVSVSGNSYVLEVDGIKYTDPRPFVDEYVDYGYLATIIDRNDLASKFQCMSQEPIDGDFHNYKLINLDTVEHTIRFYVDKSKPYSNKNVKVGTDVEVYSGRAIYCDTDKFTTNEFSGSVHERIVSDAGFSVTLAPRPLPTITPTHTAVNTVDVRNETVIKLSGQVDYSSSLGTYTGEMPSINVLVTIGDTVYTPELSDDIYPEWTLDVSSNVFKGTDKYTVNYTRRGADNPSDAITLDYKVKVIDQFTEFDTFASTASRYVLQLTPKEIVIPMGDLTEEEALAVTYRMGVRSAGVVYSGKPKISGTNLVFDNLALAMLKEAGTESSTTVGVKATIGELSLLLNTDGDYILDLASTHDSSVATPIYDSTQFDYAFAEIVGFDYSVISNTDFGTGYSGQLLVDTDTKSNLWVLRV